ncbi:alpha-1,2-fucosyltransferase [Roseovarius spongiae]|uniref:Alpha-1,2-fucosyltransferase n=1 Tax=Roseovarius spongiae TaxID=2320272 RepID=A0A3A8AX51_9RHOB|nr:alpha-1,2-fucosyltransferase [Roseovarius spongiae]RKF16296.1 alpha-1,2-fucosyltransferase [Roseovarius spongiae]
MAEADPADAITVRLFGGAGNQLFQYAAGRALADHLGCALALDSRYVAASRDRGDAFAHFAQARFRRDVALPPAKSDGMVRYALWRALGRDPRIFRERRQGFDPVFFDLKPGTYLHGYWQSPRYFAQIEDQLRRDLAFTTPLDPANAEMAARIDAAALPVALHVRRGDYVAGDSYAACPPDYYRRAAARIAEGASAAPTCFVFSNDPGWARANLALGLETVIVDINDEATGHFDMALMARCAHNVIANSTFSWWGAWLNPNADKTVIAPRTWFAKAKLHNPDLCPPGWLRL